MLGVFMIARANSALRCIPPESWDISSRTLTAQTFRAGNSFSMGDIPMGGGMELRFVCVRRDPKSAQSRSAVALYKQWLVRAQSIVMPAALMGTAHFAISRVTNSRRYSGDRLSRATTSPPIC